MQKVYSKIESIVGNVITVRAVGVSNSELAIVTSEGEQSYASVIKLDDDLVSLQVFSGAQGISTGDQVRFLGVPMRVS
ncbi:MAG: V-type ATP synthase subunit B, partial [Sphaerochaeta sp.]